MLALLYLWVFPYHAQVNNPNENVRVYMTVAIVDDGTFAINRVEREWGYVNDKSVRATPLLEAARDRRIDPEVLRGLAPDDAIARARAGRATPEDAARTVSLLYSSKAPGTSYMGVPAYWLLTRLTGRSYHALTPAQARAHHPPPLDRTVIVYVLRLWSNVLPALVFAWFWHRFLGRRTRSPALREAVFFSTMAGSLLFAYSEVFASHAHNAFCAMGALMAVATVRERDAAARETGAMAPTSAGLLYTAGLLGAAVTLFEYPAALATGCIALFILATAVEKRVWGAFLAMPFVVVGLKLFLAGHRALALFSVVLGAAAYALTLTRRSLVRLGAAGAGAALPVALALLYHKRAFGAWSKTGYSFLENAQFHSEVSQGFFGATKFSWESGLRLWLDPAFGLLPMTAVFLAALLGFGAYLSWRPPGRFVWPLRGALALAALACVVKAVLAMVAIKHAVPNGQAWPAALSEGAVWVGYAVLALIALASLCLPPPTRSDAALGATMLLICYALTRLIGMMNNWRGGWQVGPRYLATLAPILGLAALAGLDAFARGSTARRRAATVFAAGATVHAMLLSGIASAYFPHIPTEFSSPFFELFVPILREGFAPHNAGRYLFHWEGARGMLPFFVAAAIAALLVLRGDERKPLPALSHALAGAAITLLLLAPIAAAARYENMGVTRFVKGVWEPRPPAPQPSHETRGHAQVRESDLTRARRLAESGDANGALEAFRRAAQQAPR